MIRAIILDFFGVLENYGEPNRQLLDFIKTQLKPKYKVGVISNAAGDWLYEILPAADVQLFDDIVLSHRAGVAKPELAIYRLSLKNLGVIASEAVFIDDLEPFCQAAKQLGMKAILYESFPQMRRDLGKILSPDS